MVWLVVGYGWDFVAGVLVTLLLIGRVREARRLVRRRQWGAFTVAMVAVVLGVALSGWGMHPVGAPWFVWQGMVWRILAFVPGLIVGRLIAHRRWQRGVAHGYDD